MQYQWEAGQQVGDFFKAGKVKFRFAFKFICAVAGADSNSKGVNAGAFYKFNSLVGVGVGSVFGVYFNCVFNTGKAAEFSFYNNAFGLLPSIITEVKPPSTQALQISKSSPWSRCRQMGRPVSSTAASTSFIK